MAAVRIHKVFVSSDGREKVELFGPKDGLYGLRLWQRKRKAWRRTAEACQYDCYVSLAYDAGERVKWLRRLRSYELEHLRGLTFECALYTEARFGGDHDHCSACWANSWSVNGPMSCTLATSPAVRCLMAPAPGNGFGCVKSVSRISEMRSSGD